MVPCSIASRSLRDYADVEEALVLGVAEPLEGALVLVAVTAATAPRRSRVAEVRHHVPEPVGVDAVVGVDRDTSTSAATWPRAKFSAPAFEAFQRGNVEEAGRARPGGARSARLDRLPDGRVAGVVVDHRDFVVG